MDVTPWIVGFHLFSLHDPGCYQERGNCIPYNKTTTGVYAKSPSGFTYGGYTNSYGDPSAYAGWTFETRDRRFALLVGGVTGYERSPLLPLVVPSVRVPVTRTMSLRLAGLPRTGLGAAVVHLALEFER